jgi:preprotein translocase subunit SecY
MNEGVKFAINALFKAKELHKRLGFTFILLAIYRFASQVSLPGIDVENITAFQARIAKGFLSTFDMLSGGSMSRMTIMAFNIGPYISASILFNQLLTQVHPYFAALKKQGELGRAQLNQYTRYAALGMSLGYGYGLAIGLEIMQDTASHVIYPGILFRLMIALTICCSTAILIWLSEQISSRGIGNGSSVIIFCGIVANFPNSLFKLLEIGQNSEYGILKVLLVAAIIFVLLFIIVFCEKVERTIDVQYTRKQVSAALMIEAKAAKFPIRLNPSGPMPAIFAGQVVMVPVSIIYYLGLNKYSWGESLMSGLQHGGWLYVWLYGIAVYTLATVAANAFFDCENVAFNLNQSGGFVKGYRPGAQTQALFEKILRRVSLFGGLYLVLVCIVPEIMLKTSLVSVYFSGTSLLIVVSVIVDFVQRVQTAILEAKYGKLFEKGYGGLLW